MFISLLLEWSTDTHYNMHEPWKYAKWKKTATKDHMLYDSVHVKIQNP